MIFGGSCDGYELIAGNPFRFLRIACKLQSKVIYQEAMTHAVGIYDAMDDSPECDAEWFSKIGDDQLYRQFKSHAKEFHKKVSSIARHLLSLQPDCCNKLGASRDMGMAIFRDWLAQSTFDGHLIHGTIIKILKRDYDIPRMITQWKPYQNNQIMCVNFGHIHRTIENSFYNAHDMIQRLFSEGRESKVSTSGHIGSVTVGSCGGKYHYYANVHFRKSHEYPWEMKKQESFATFDPFTFAAARDHFP